MSERSCVDHLARIDKLEKLCTDLQCLVDDQEFIYKEKLEKLEKDYQEKLGILEEKNAAQLTKIQQFTEKSNKFYEESTVSLEHEHSIEVAALQDKIIRLEKALSEERRKEVTAQELYEAKYQIQQRDEKLIEQERAFNERSRLRDLEVRNELIKKSKQMKDEIDIMAAKLQEQVLDNARLEAAVHRIEQERVILKHDIASSRKVQGEKDIQARMLLKDAEASEEQSAQDFAKLRNYETTMRDIKSQNTSLKERTEKLRSVLFAKEKILREVAYEVKDMLQVDPMSRHAGVLFKKLRFLYDTYFRNTYMEQRSSSCRDLNMLIEEVPPSKFRTTEPAKELIRQRDYLESLVDNMRLRKELHQEDSKRVRAEAIEQNKKLIEDNHALRRLVANKTKYSQASENASQADDSLNVSRLADIPKKTSPNNSYFKSRQPQHDEVTHPPSPHASLHVVAGKILN